MSRDYTRCDFRTRFLIETIDQLLQWIDGRLDALKAADPETSRLMDQRDMIANCRGGVLIASRMRQRDMTDQPD
jgi:hypothetical protein